MAVGTIAALVAGAPRPADADDRDRTRSELAGVRQRIAELTSELNTARTVREQEIVSLRDVELRAAQLSERSRVLAARLADERRRAAALERERIARQATLAAARANLGAHARAGYALGRRDGLGVLLGHTDAATLARFIGYHRTIQREQVARAARAREEHAALQAAERELAARTVALERTQAQADGVRDELAAELRRRRGIVQAISASMQERGERISVLRADAQRLERLLAGLERQLEDLTYEREITAAPFPSLRGKLPWPVEGKLLKRFGARRGDQLPRWQGILVGSQPGTDVRAVAGGRVAYADWLRGFGLLVILEHGDGYMTLYGRNQSLYKEVGDWVEAGDVVATVGDSGGAEVSGLYFELRRSGTPLDPLHWVRAPARAGASLVPDRDPPVFLSVLASSR